MANRYLLPLYRELYGKDFHYAAFEQRMEMQKAIYLLQDMGVPVGDYGFRWYLHGPYSQELQDDMYYEDGKPLTRMFWSEENTKNISQLHDVILSDRREPYSIAFWVECLASMHYLQKNILSFDATESDVISELTKRKPHLNDSNANVAAYQLLQELFA